jgi:tetratricopeptide (TPR) repeat protein
MQKKTNMKKIISLLIICNISWAQNNLKNIDAEHGAKAFQIGDFTNAKINYLKSVQLYPNSRDNWYNLAVTELKLGETDQACEHFYKTYLLGDYQVVSDIKQFCPNFRNGSILSIEETTEKPKFISKGKYYDLFESKNFSKIYINLLTKALRRSSLYSYRIQPNAKLYVSLTINKNGLSIIDIKFHNVDNRNLDDLKTEISKTITEFVEYIPAKSNELSVDLWERWSLPINITE